MTGGAVGLRSGQVPRAPTQARGEDAALKGRRYESQAGEVAMTLEEAMVRLWREALAFAQAPARRSRSTSFQQEELG